jgi:hypothetical protein
MNITRVLEGLAAGLLLAAWVFAGLTIPALPAIVPTHFGFSGVPDGAGPKASLWALPVLCTVLYGIIIGTQRLPMTALNFPVKITDRNREPVYALAREILPALKAGAVLCFLGLEWGSIDSAARGGMSPIFVPAVYGPVVLIFAVLIVYTVRMRSA